MKLKYKNSFKGYFLFYYRVVGNRLLVFLGLSVLISFLDGIGLAMFIPLLQSVANPGSHAGEESLGQLHYFTDFIHWLGLDLTVTTVLLVLIMMFALKGMMRFTQLSYYAALRQMFIKKIRYSLVDNLQGLSYGAFSKLDAGRIQNTLTVEVQRLFQTMKFYFDASQAFVMLATYMALAFLANYQFAFLVGIGAALSNLVYRKIYKATKRASNELSKKGSDFNGFLTQTTLYFKYLKSTNTFNLYARKLKLVINDAEHLNRKIGNMNAITTSVKEPMIIIVVSLVILLQMNWMGATLSTIILSLLLFYRALSFLVTVQNHWQGFIENIGGMNAVANMLEEMSSLREEKGSIPFKGLNNQIAFNNVVFSYDEIPVLNGLNIVIPRKSTVALVGESGSGKTTIANMIAGLIQPTRGELLLDQTSIRQIELDSYRSNIGYISQESVIFNDTIFNNVTFWAEPTPENVRRFEEVVEMASLKEFVLAQPQQRDSRLGDNGILISGGQKQRISIARELYKNSEILIFDEATSALDSETERIIQGNIEKLYGNFTMVLIAHRLSTIKRADTIYLIEQGKVSASGSFEEMIHKSSRFKKLVSLQAF
ncbi:ABC transporter ATP-binding protein [Paraflavitalea sp. CAU 1676]|uniref:ABC transporter ATP-binding protein n=1 Tax=Paraflavitalea sp. CAU 1676 TaxID=3032598 RepID=UPI0023DCD042|nr:ABC transporter ATP-binding protein [Paraflavitalea sp. CAU 1676]MDF2189650.1 ABC transporter ATP-binding protein [Paraflavitalea sp. CAU 1676]